MIIEGKSRHKSEALGHPVGRVSLGDRLTRPRWLALWLFCLLTVIYNINGQKVRTLVDDVKTPGFYKMVWDGRNNLGENVASGVYLYKMISGDFSKIQKMTFIK